MLLKKHRNSSKWIQDSNKAREDGIHQYYMKYSMQNESDTQGSTFKKTFAEMFLTFCWHQWEQLQMLTASQNRTCNPVPSLLGIITEKQLFNYLDLNTPELFCS